MSLISAPPLLSVVIPTYDGERFLDQALDSLVADTANDSLDDLEILVVDDRSHDATIEVAKAYANRLPLSVRQRTGPRSWVRGTNEGLASARGQFASFLHQDDVWLPGRLRSIRRHLEQSPELDWLLGTARVIEESGRKIGVWRPPLSSRHTVDTEELFDRLLIQNFVPIPAVVFRTQAVLEIGGLDEGLWYTADWDLWLRLAASGARTTFDPVPSAGFRVHARSQTILRSISTGELRNQLETVLARHLPQARSKPSARAAMFSVEVNLALASLVHGTSPDWKPLVVKTALLGPVGFWRYCKSSRLLSRVIPRLRLLAR